MQQNWIATFIIIGFLVYITSKGELSQYKAVVIGGTQGSAPPATGTTNPLPAMPPPTNSTPTVPNGPIYQG